MISSIFSPFRSTIVSCTTLLSTFLFYSATSATLPNIVFILTDDQGYNFPGYRNPEVITPTLDTLANEGVKIDEFYTYQFCAPSRGSFLTGRYPWRLPSTRINFIPAYIMDGTQLNFTMVPQRLASQGYVNYHIGKWHQGLYTPAYTPLYRGFNYSNGFLCGGEDHFEQYGDLSVGNCNQSKTTPDIRDIFVQNRTDANLIGNYTGTRFADAAVDYIKLHAEKYSTSPLFMYLALHNTHAPLQSLPQFTNLYKNYTWETQQQYYAMVSTVDSSVKNVTDTLKALNMWDNTIVFWATDNGAPPQVGGSNYPLRGGKGSNWEGGIKCPAFVSGGYIPTNRRGTTVNNGFMHIVDLYSTFLTLGGITNTSDPDGSFAPIDSLNMWPWLMGQVPTSPRTTMVIDHNMYDVVDNGITGAMRSGNYKLLVGGPAGELQSTWYGWFTPNASHPNPSLDYYACSNKISKTNPYPGCLFDLVQDPTEHNDLASTNPTLFYKLYNEFLSYNTSYHPPVDNPPGDEAGLCKAAIASNGIVTPWRSEPLPSAYVY